eukprot:8066209-Pyramimonas_sp.AAC.1
MDFLARRTRLAFLDTAAAEQVYSHDGPIGRSKCRRSKRGYILLTDQSDTGNPTVGLDTAAAEQVCSPEYSLTTDQTDAVSAGIFSRRTNETQ